MAKAFEPSSCAAAWVAEAVQVAAAEQVDHAFDQRRFRADDGQLHVLFGEVRQLFDGGDVDGDVLALGLGGGAGVAGRDEDFLDTRVLRDFPGQGVLTPTAANDQNVHVKNLECCRAWVQASRCTRSR